MAGAQQLKKVETALRSAAAEPGELRIADLGAEAVLGLVARTGVVDGDPGGIGKPGPQHVAGLRQEALLAGDQQANDLALGDVDAEAVQQPDQPRHRDLSLMILGEHEAAQFGSEMTVDAVRQRRHDRLAVRGLPALPAEMRDPRLDHQVLNQEAGIAFETRAGRRRGLERPLLVDRQFGFRAAAPTALATGHNRRGLARLIHSARLDVRPAGSALQPRNLVALQGNHPTKIGHLLQKPQHHALELRSRKSIKVRRWRHSLRESENHRFG